MGALAPAMNDSSSARATSTASKPITHEASDTQAEILPLLVVSANSEATTGSLPASTASLVGRGDAPSYPAPSSQSALSAEPATPRGSQADPEHADQPEASPPGKELSPSEETGPMAEPGETLFAPQTAPQLLDGQPVDVPALDGLLRQVLNGLTDLGSDAAESDSLHNVIAWVEVGLVALVGLEVGRRWQRRRTAPLIANADWLGWIDLDGPSPETLR